MTTRISNSAWKKAGPKKRIGLLKMSAKRKGSDYSSFTIRNKKLEDKIKW